MTKPFGMGMRVAGMLLLVGIFSAACSQQASQSTPSEPPIGTLIDVSKITDYAFPLDPYRYLLWQENVNRKAVSLLTARCLQRFDLEAPEAPKAIPERDISFERRYSLVPALAAARYGYKLPQAGGETAKQPDAPLDPDVKTVLGGEGQSTYHGVPIPKGGCYGEANRAIGADIDPGRLADGLDAKALDLTENDSRVVAQIHRWGACMKAAGFDYESPQNAVADPTLQSDTTSSAEIKVATSSAECAVTKTQLLATSLTVDVAYQKRLIEENAAALTAIKQAREAEGRKAAGILAGG